MMITLPLAVTAWAQHLIGSMTHHRLQKLDRLKKLMEKNLGLVFLPGHNCASDYRGTAQSFQTVAIYPQELHDAVTAVKIKNDAILCSWDVQLMCQALGIIIPLLLVKGGNEYCLFTFCWFINIEWI
jgi:hypothetical protein